MLAIDAIREVVASEFRCHPALLSASVSRPSSLMDCARQVAISLCRELTNHGLYDIAANFNQAPSLALADERSVQERSVRDPLFAARLRVLRARCSFELSSRFPAMKYIRHKTLGFVIFEAGVQHSDLAKLLGDPAQVESAGFAFFPQAKPLCMGFSGSLNIESAPTDSGELRDRMTAIAV